MGESVENNPKIFLGIPGTWKDRQAFKDKFNESQREFVYLGEHIGKLQTPEYLYQIEFVDEHIPYVAEAFELGGNGSFTKGDIETLQSHRSMVYILAEGGSLEQVIEIMSVAKAVLQSGGLAVSVESSGKATTKNNWIEYVNNGTENRAFAAFVQMSREEDVFYTCGMHNFGYKDLLTSTSNTNPAETVELFQTFCLYTLIENPVFNSGETFSVDPKAPVFQLRAESCVLFESDDPFYNPYGVWRLNKIS